MGNPGERSLFTGHQTEGGLTQEDYLREMPERALLEAKPDTLLESPLDEQHKKIKALEKAKEEKKAQGEIETHHLVYLGAQDT